MISESATNSTMLLVYILSPRPLYDMGDVVEHKQLLKRIEQTFPEMDQSGCLRVYANIIKCVEKKHLVCRYGFKLFNHEYVKLYNYAMFFLAL